jgi:hypothetical protein
VRERLREEEAVKPIDKEKRPYAAVTHTAEKGDRVEFAIAGGNRLEIYFDEVRGAVRIHKTGEKMAPIAIEPCVSNEVIVK